MTKRIASREFFPVPMQLIIVHVIIIFLSNFCTRVRLQVSVCTAILKNFVNEKINIRHRESVFDLCCNVERVD